MKFSIRIAAVLGALTLSTSSLALTLAPGDADWSGSWPHNPDAGDVECIVGGSIAQDKHGDSWSPACTPTGALEELYKADQVDGAAPDESGALAISYTTVYIPNGDEPPDYEQPEDAIISWDGGDFADCDTSDGSQDCYLLVKDGKQDPVWYLYDLSDLGSGLGFWDGRETIYLDGFWIGPGAISHVSIFGGPTEKVSEPGSLALIGLGLIGMGLMRRRRRS